MQRGPEDDPSNYRPIAVVSVDAKILQKIAAIQFSREMIYYTLIRVHTGAEGLMRTFFWWLLILLLIMWIYIVCAAS